MPTINPKNQPPYKAKKSNWLKDKFDFQKEFNHPKHLIAKSVVCWSFIAAIVITLIVVINYWCFRDCENKVPDILGDLKIIWEIVTPFITLVLGYEFGRNEK